MKTLVFVLLIVLAYGLWGYGTNLPQEVGLDVQDGKLNSLSFAPYREGQGPREGIFPTVAEIDSDLKLMAQKTHAIRTYASAEGTMPAIPELARKHGLNMLQGAWLSADKKKNREEIDALIKSANSNPDVVKRVVVGNEVLLRGDLKVDELLDYIREVRRSIKQPVTYAEVWSMYMQNPQLMKEVDFVTVHILPYWEDEPIAIDAAPAHVERVYQRVQREAYAVVPNIPILIGESGWPSVGRQRGYALPSVTNAASYIRSFIKIANTNHFDYNIVEAFNQSWKSEQEGVVGANWGLYSVDRKQVFPLTGKVYEHPEWLQSLLIAVGLFLALVLLCWKPLQTLNSLQQFSLLLFAQLLIALVVHQFDVLWYTSYSHWQRLLTILLVGLNVAIGGLSIQRSFCQLSQQTFEAQRAKLFYWLLVSFAVLAVIKTVQLAQFGRYISFPTECAYIPVVAVLGYVFFKAISGTSKSGWLVNIYSVTDYAGQFSPWNRRLGNILSLAAILLIFGEAKALMLGGDFIKDHPDFSERLRLALHYSVANEQLMLWILCLVVLAIPFQLASKHPEHPT